MLYFGPKADLAFIIQVKKDIEELWLFEAQIKKDFKPSVMVSGIDYAIAVENQAMRIPGCKEVRERIANSLPKTKSLTDKYNTGSNVNPFHISTANHIFVEDNLNSLIGQIERKIGDEFRQIINPFYLIYLLIQFILRTPFILITATGFNVSKIEDHLWGKIFKILELLAISYITYKLSIE